MRLRVLTGLLGLGIGLGGLIGNIYYDHSAPAIAYDPLASECVRLLGALQRQGESTLAIDARLARLGLSDRAVLAYQASGRDGVGAVDLAVGDGTLSPPGSLVPEAEPAVLASQRMAASGRGSGPATVGEEFTFPSAGRVAPTKGDAALRALPSLTAPVLRVVPRGSALVLLGIERGQAVEGSEDRWYRARDGDSTGFVYFNLVERVW